MYLGVLIAAIEGGDYVSAIKVLPVVLLLLLWAKLLTWIDKDAPAARLPRVEINAALLGGLVFGFILLLLLPNFWLAFGLLFLVFLLEIGVYLLLRHQKVGLADLKSELRNLFKSSGKKVVEAPPGELVLMTKKGGAIEPPTAEDPNRLAYDAIQRMLTGPMKRGLERFELMPADTTAAVRYAIDGVTYLGGNIDRNEAAAAITYLKNAAGLDVNERRKPQKGIFRIQLENKRTDVELETAGKAAGEWMVLLTDPRNRHNLKLDNVGLSAEQMQTVQQSIADNSGLVLVAAPKGQGLTSLMYAIIRKHDAFLQHIHTIEREPTDDLEGITQNKLPAMPSPAEEFQMVSWVTSQEPDVLVVTAVDDPKTAMEMVRFAENGRRVYVGMRANSSFEALTQWRRLVGDDRAATKSLTMVITGRVLRRLCEACKVGYRPDPQQLRKLNMDPDQVGQLYQARVEPVRDSKGNEIPCQFCADLHYKGRIGIFEILLMTEEMRQVVLAGGDPGMFRSAFRKQHGRSLQEMALAQVQAGVTSMQEVLRVLQPPAPPPGSSPGSPARLPPPAPAPAPALGRPSVRT